MSLYSITIDVQQSIVAPGLWNCRYTILRDLEILEAESETLPPHQVLFFITSAHMKLEALSGVCLHFEPDDGDDT